MIKVTLEFSCAADAAAALAKLAAAPALSPADNPAVGAPSPADVPVPEAAVNAARAAAVFAPPVPPTPPAAPTVPAAPAVTLPSAATVPTAAPATQPIEFDSRGLPWDARIHSGNKSRNADGSWRKLRGVDDALFAQVEAELLGRFPRANTLPPVAAVPVPPPVAAVPVAPPVAAVPVPPPVAAVPALTTCTDFASYMAEVGPAFDADPAGTTQRFTAACQAAGLSHLGMLAQRPDLIPVVDRAYKGLPPA